jgi:hypothetical protein
VRASLSHGGAIKGWAAASFDHLVNVLPVPLVVTADIGRGVYYNGSH